MNGYADMILDGDKKCGVLGRWAVCIRSGRNASMTVIADRNEDRKTLRAVQARLKETGKRIGCLWAKGRITFFWSADKLGSMTEEECVRACLEALEGAGVEPNVKCPLCSREGCDAAALVAGDFRPAHMECVEKRAESLEEKARENEYSGLHVTGFLGAVAGMFVGTIPSVIAALLVERVFVLLMALIPLCVYYGYKLFRGRMDKTPLVLSVVLSPVGVIAMQWEMLAAEMLRSYPGMGLSRVLRYVWMQMQYRNNWMEILSSSYMEFLFAAIGIFIMWSVISRSSGSDVKDAQAMRKFMTPYGDERKSLL